MGLIRLFLALSVVLTHSGIVIWGIEGYLAVMAFFIISGFYMALVLNEKYTSGKLEFYVARYLRIWPPYIVVLLATCFVYPPVGQLPPVAAAWTWFSSITLFLPQSLWWFITNDAREVVSFATEVPKGSYEIVWLTRMVVMWSVGIELVFYAVAPFMARKPKVLALLFVLAYALHAVIEITLPFTHPLVLRSSLNYFWLFFAGMLAYWAWRSVRLSLPDMSRWYSPIIAGFACFLCMLGARSVWQKDGWFPLLTDPFLIAFAGVVILAFHATRKNRTDQLIGELSYPAYLVHWPIVTLWVTWGRGEWGTAAYIVTLTLGCSVMLYALVDKPIEMLKRRIHERGLTGPRSEIYGHSGFRL